MIYTSYFGNIINLESVGIIPIAICGGIPEYYEGKWYKKLAPSWSIYIEYKNSGNSERYTTRFLNEILAKRNAKQSFQDLCDLAGRTDNFAMICYEKPGEFCHRHLITDWFKEHGIDCQEYKQVTEF